MPTSCSAFNCTNRFQKGSEITFHRIPKDEIRRKQWIDAVRRKKWNPSPNTFLCSEHFESECFFRNNGRKILKSNSVPTIFNFPDHLKKKEVTPRAPKRRYHTDAESSEVCVSSVNIIQKRPKLSSIFNAHNYSLLDPEQKIESLSKKNLKMQQKLKVAQQAANRRELSLEKKSKIISELQKRLGEQENQIIDSCFIPVLKELILKKSQTGYSEAVRKFSLTLNFYSSKAYDFLREHVTLPHPSTLRRWAEKVDCSPGFTQSALKKIENIAKEKELLCCLIVDEMALKKQIDWDGKEIVGYCDLGQGLIDNECIAVATSALVFLVTAINDSWKIPIGYCFISGLSSSVRASLVSQYVQKIEETGAKCVALTCDGCPSNIGMLNDLGGNIQGENIVHYFSIPEIPHLIYIILDPSHMLKLIRNLLAEKKVIVSNSGIIKWEYLVNLQKLQEEEGLHAGNKLRRRHIEWWNQKMKVNIAAQTLSQSVSSALHYCNINNIPGFEDCEATIVFTHNINKLFDFLNSCHPFAKGTKASIRQQNKIQSLEFKENIIDYLKSLKDTAGKRIIDGGRRIGTLGFIVDVLSILDIAKEYVWTNPKMNFFLTKKLSQDHLELFFCTIRSRGGHNNNPSPLQFKAAYRKTLMAQIDCREAGNCETNCTTLLDPVPLSLPKNDSKSNFNVHFDHDYICQYESLSDFSSTIIDYISGNVVKAAITQVKCIDCKLILMMNDNTAHSNSLISIKNKGGLKNPLQDCKKLLKVAERVFRSIFGKEPNPRKDLYSKFIQESIFLTYDTSIFKDFDHLFVSTEVSDESHWSKLVKLLLKKYFNIRINHVCRTKSVKSQGPTVRQKLTKLILFKGQ